MRHIILKTILLSEKFSTKAPYIKLINANMLNFNLVIHKLFLLTNRITYKDIKYNLCEIISSNNGYQVVFGIFSNNISKCSKLLQDFICIGKDFHTKSFDF